MFLITTGPVMSIEANFTLRQPLYSSYYYLYDEAYSARKIANNYYLKLVIP